MKLGIIRESKVPADSRVPLNPAQCQAIMASNPTIKIVVQPSPNRCFTDKEYRSVGIPMEEDLSDCAVLMGVKEVPTDLLLNDKIYFFFSHTIKKQSYNRGLLQSILTKNIQLLDYEVLPNERKQRLIAFGVFAGMVGAHNAVWTYGQKTGLYELKRMKDFFDYAAAKEAYKDISLPPIRIVLTGGGRVANGAASVLQDMDIIKVSADDFLTKDFRIPVFTQLDCHQYATRKDGSEFELQDFFDNPAKYQSSFAPYTKVSDIMINGIYWDNAAPAFFSIEDMKQSDYNIKVIADVTCDIAPVSSIPSTLRASTIADPVFGFNPYTGHEVSPFQKAVVDMMTIDNLPNELPRDASTSFGEQFITSVLQELKNKGNSDIIRRATVTKDGELGEHFRYLEDYVG
jgi:saccharopine dehydrogenase (NAD+, L-lysine-forming)